ncbi:serine hydrolase domain-containing protein [Microlunatus soli]|uniref:D-alanyl-D-alanine carboxypeptidase n=1 Tax=Microlunatus soli TaxID=630515 RepID=A0A1H1NG51_9ACTN|nr:serine hydrolase domain-containing protein [Microlunatus soli]SDR97924.1 D-alanyl-D-alanine carboxypeptidase [Microlunatus soli]
MATIDQVALQAAMEDVRRAGMPGLFAEVRDGADVWRGAVGVADLATGRPVAADLRHRVGSITKTVTAAAVLQLVEQQQVGLDTAIGHYLPELVPGQRGRAITVRMLLGHTSGLAEYLPYAFPSLGAFPRLAETTPDSLDDHRFTRFDPVELIALGVAAPPAGRPGGRPGVYSNTNYLLLAQLLERVTGAEAEEHITRQVIEPAGLTDTELPTTPQVAGPHSRAYESWFQMIDPPRDYSVYDMSWVGPAASMISTVADLNRLYTLLLAGEIVSHASLEQMQRTGPVISFEGTTIEYGLGLHRQHLPGYGTFWGHDGTTWGSGAISMIRSDGRRQFSVAVNLLRPNRLDASGRPQKHPLDAALPALYRVAMGDVDSGVGPSHSAVGGAHCD